MGRPPVMLVDMRPVNPPMVLVPSHSIAEQISKPSQGFPLSTPKSPTWTHMIPIIGTTAIIGREVIHITLACRLHVAPHPPLTTLT